MFMIVTTMNAVIFRSRSRKHIESNPELAEGYGSLIRGFMIWGNIPWIVMGVGLTAGGVPSVWHYFRPMDGNPHVLAWFASIFFIWLMGTYWLFLQDGAEKLAKHPGFIKASFVGEISSANAIKFIWVLCLLGGVFGVVMMWTMDAPLPPLH